MTPKTIKIDNVEYVQKDSLPVRNEGPIKIAVLDRGFVYVGEVKEEKDFIILNCAKNIRYWGTKNGLGELVNGPLSGTKLDSVGTVRIPLRAVISLIDVNQEKWTTL
jgi:hypothetical protein